MLTRNKKYLYRITFALVILLVPGALAVSLLYGASVKIIRKKAKVPAKAAE